MLLFSGLASAQLPGLVAHWPFNGNTNDSSGNGFDGIPGGGYSYTTGVTGASNTAARFQNQAYVTVAYKPAINLNSFSICAMIKLIGFNNAPCQLGTILTRGPSHYPGHYGLFFTDNPFDLSCLVSDTNKNVFISTIGDKTDSITLTDWQYTPTMKTATWYSVVTTYDNNVSKIYVNGVLKSTINTAPGPIGAHGSVGLSIGSTRFGNTPYDPYALAGDIDDLRLYNRALNATEVAFYNKIANGIESEFNDEDKTISLYPNPNDGNFTITYTLPSGKDMSIEILNSLGQLVYRTQLTSNVGRTTKTIKTSDLSDGLYLLRTNVDGVHRSQIFVIRK